MNRLWEKYLPQIEERVATLQRAADSLASGDLPPGEQKKAASDAHKLAGVLGTFGLNHGTELAREAETLYQGSEDEDAASNHAAGGDRGEVASDDCGPKIVSISRRSPQCTPSNYTRSGDPTRPISQATRLEL